MFVVIFPLSPFKCFFKNVLGSDNFFIDNGKLFHRFPPEYIKLHLNKSNLGQDTLSLCECLF